MDFELFTQSLSTIFSMKLKNNDALGSQTDVLLHRLGPALRQWLSILVRKRLRIADFDSKAHLTERLDAFMRERNERAHPFR